MHSAASSRSTSSGHSDDPADQRAANPEEAAAAEGGRVVTAHAATPEFRTARPVIRRCLPAMTCATSRRPPVTEQRDRSNRPGKAGPPWDWEDLERELHAAGVLRMDNLRPGVRAKIKIKRAKAGTLGGTLRPS